MANVAYLPIEVDRYGAAVRQIYIRGLDLTGIAMRAQVRLGGDVPGTPLADLQTVTNGTAEGLRLVEVTNDAGVPVSHVQLIINETTIKAMPYAGELGSETALAWDWQITLAGRKQRIAKGEFVITGDGVTGADSAPAARLTGWSSSFSPSSGMRAGATLTFGSETISVAIDGADLLGPLASKAQQALDKITDFTRGDTGPANSTYLTLAKMQAAAVSDRSYNLASPTGSDGGVVNGAFFYRTDQAPYVESNDVVRLTAVPLTDGALVRQGAEGIAFIPSGATPRTRTTQDKARERRTILDKSGGVPDGATSNRAALLALIADGGGIIPAGTYVLDVPVTIPAGTILTHEGSPTIIYKGTAPPINTGILSLGGDNIAIRPVDNSVLTIQAQNPSGRLYAVHGSAVSNIEVGNVQGVGCSHFLFRTSAITYADATEANSCHNIKVYGGGARFDAIPTGVEGAGYIGYSWDVDVRDCAYLNCVQGIQWWGGDSNPQGDGAYTNKRKVGRLRIRNVKVTNVALGGIWGSMGQDIRVESCDVDGAHDVGLDAEGCFDTRFISCTAKNCVNGAAAGFFINENLVFDLCTLEMNNGPCFRNYNSGQNAEPRSVTLSRCLFKGAGNRFSTVDTANGSTRSLTIENCTFDNARIVAIANNLNIIRIVGNRFDFSITPAVETDLIAVAGMHGFVLPAQIVPQRATVLVRGNMLLASADQRVGTRALNITSDDSNFQVLVEASNNIVRVGLQNAATAPMLFQHVGANAGVVSYFLIRGNVTDGPIQTSSAGAAAPGVFMGDGNKSTTLADVPLTGA